MLERVVLSLKGNLVGQAALRFRWRSVFSNYCCSSLLFYLLFFFYMYNENCTCSVFFSSFFRRCVLDKLWCTLLFEPQTRDKVTREICFIFFFCFLECFLLLLSLFSSFIWWGKKRKGNKKRWVRYTRPHFGAWSIETRHTDTPGRKVLFFSFLLCQLLRKSTALYHCNRLSTASFALSLRQEKTKATQTVLKTCLKNNPHLTLTEVLPCLR